MTQRLQRHPFLALFDGPDTNASTEGRRASIVPQQALFALNGAFVDVQANLLAQRILREREDTAGRVRYLLQLAWGRDPLGDELQKYSAWLSEARQHASQANVAADRCEEEAWASLCRVTLAANEFIYVD